MDGVKNGVNLVHMLRTANSPKESELLLYQFAFVLERLAEQDQSCVYFTSYDKVLQRAKTGFTTVRVG